MTDSVIETELSQEELSDKVAMLKNARKLLDEYDLLSNDEWFLSMSRKEETLKAGLHIQEGNVPELVDGMFHVMEDIVSKIHDPVVLMKASLMIQMKVLGLHECIERTIESMNERCGMNPDVFRSMLRGKLAEGVSKDETGDG